MCGHSYRQSWGFGEALATKVGASCEHIGIFTENDCTAIADVRVRELPVLGGGIAYISGGPLIQRRPWVEFEPALGRVLEVLVDEYVNRRGLVLRIAPPIEWAAAGCNVSPLFNKLDFIPVQNVRRYRTILIDLTPDLEQIRKNLNQKWRNCLNRAEKNELTIRAGNDVEFFNRFCSLHQDLVERKGFDVELSAEFYRDLQSQLDTPERFHIKLVEFDGQPIAGHVGSMLGQTSVYLLGASNPTGNDLKASYLMQWASIIEAKKQGYTWYDLGGIDPEGNPGVFLFKERMGGIDMTAPGPYELRPSGIRAHVTQFAENLYRAIRQRRKK